MVCHIKRQKTILACSRTSHPPHTRIYLVNQSDNSNRTNCLVESYFRALGLILVWNLLNTNKHLAVEVRSGKTGWISDWHSLYKLHKPHQTFTKQKFSIRFPGNIWSFSHELGMLALQLLSRGQVKESVYFIVISVVSYIQLLINTTSCGRLTIGTLIWCSIVCYAVIY